MVRMRSYDWGNEADCRMAIECLDLPLLKRRMSVAEIEEKLTGAFTLSERLNPLFYGFQNRVLANSGKNVFELEAFSDTGLANQLYWACVYELAEDEALIVETELPEVRPYWNIQVNDPYFNAVEFVYRQTSLNGHTALVDADGQFRAVLAHGDPGVANWLDTGGFTEGTLFGRWMQCSSTPLPSARRVKLAEIGDHLPPDTPRVTPEQRVEALRKRRIGAQLRRRW
jgi:hypothetical protein